MPPKKTSPVPAAPEASKSSPPPRLPADAIYLMDTMSFIFRAYHAMARQRGMSTKTGLPTAAIYVFVNMLRKLRDDFSPRYLAAVFDVAAPTFRDQQAKAFTSVRRFDLKTQTFQEQEYLGYKANRSEMPGDLVPQVPYIRRALEAYRIPIIEQQNFEADDVIGTLARQAADQGRCVYVVSSDKDMMQLVNKNVFILNPPKDNLILDAAKVEEVLGVPPERVIDVMALRGDAIDNIPGAPGIGDKGSVDLIQRFGSVEAALERAAEVERKTYRESLQNNRDNILLSKQLVTIDCRVPVELDILAMELGEPDSGALRALFTELEFNSLLKEILPTEEVTQTNYVEASSAIDVEKTLRTLRDGAALVIAVDAAEEPYMEEAPLEDEAEEAQSLLLPLSEPEEKAPPEMRQPKFAISATPGASLSIGAENPEAYARVVKAIADESIPKTVHDAKSVMHVLARSGIEIGGLAHDPMLYSFLIDPSSSSHRIADVAMRRFNLKLNGTLPESADLAGRLATSLRSDVEEAGLLKTYEDIDLPLVPVLARMERAGVKIDRQVLNAMSTRLETEIAAKAREIYDLAGVEFNVNSPKQLGDVLFNRLGLPKPVKYGKGRTISTAVDVLEGLAEAHEVPRKVLDYRQLSKLKSTYVDALPAMLNPATQRLHTTFGQTGAATGRLNSTNPNLQNIPIRTELGREIRAAFTAESGHVLMSADYSQIELRLLAHYSADELLVEAYGRGDDIHTLTASQVFGVPPLMVTPDHRRQAKVVNFGIVYGLSPFGLARDLGITPSEGKQFITAYFERYAGVRRFIDTTLEEVRREGKVKTLFGRVRPIPDINSKNANLRGFAERTAVNTPLQGTAADLIKIAMIRIDAALLERNMKSRMTLQVHDELVFEVPEEEVDAMQTLVREHMENVHPQLSVPLLVEIGVGKNWRDMD